ncbi:hypothetical protein BSFA1_83570 (plasmid) [Burkholderia sp. SFA1]|nr:hypothetical protein BSFA1_83570 [Burkholderia sp. SFA1]
MITERPAVSKQELIDEVASQAGGSKATVEEAINVILTTISWGSGRGNLGSIERFGSFASGGREANWAQSPNRRDGVDPRRENGEVHGRKGV